VVVLALVGAGCSEDEPTPEEARLQRVRERLERSFTEDQVTCMLDQLDDAVLASLDRGEGTQPSGPELEAFSQVATECVVGTDGRPGEGDDGSDPTSTTDADDSTPSTTAAAGEESPAPDDTTGDDPAPAESGDAGTDDEPDADPSEGEPTGAGDPADGSAG
jgi:hypothetical protein